MPSPLKVPISAPVVTFIHLKSTPNKVLGIPIKFVAVVKSPSTPPWSTLFGSADFLLYGATVPIISFAGNCGPICAYPLFQKNDIAVVLVPTESLVKSTPSGN